MEAFFLTYVMICAIWYHLYNLKNVKNTHERLLLLVKLQAKSRTPPRVFFPLFKLYKWLIWGSCLTFGSCFNELKFFLVLKVLLASISAIVHHVNIGKPVLRIEFYICSIGS